MSILIAPDRIQAPAPVSRKASAEWIIQTPWWPIVVKPGALILLTAYMVAGGFFLFTKRLELTGANSVAWYEAVTIGVLVLTGLFFHESGHAVAGKMTGRKVLRLQFGLAGGAVTSGDSTPVRRMISIAAGPLAEIAFGIAFLALGGGSLATAFGVAGLLSLINGIGNLVPFHKTTDGYRFLKFSRLALRGNEPLRCMESGPCPACAAEVS